MNFVLVPDEKITSLSFQFICWSLKQVFDKSSFFYETILTTRFKLSFLVIERD